MRKTTSVATEIYPKLNTSLFQDVSEEITDNWLHGVLIGGMASSEEMLAQAYKNAGDALVAEALGSREPYLIGEPIIFLYRHTLELYLKLVVKPTKKNHDLRTLFSEFERILEVEHKRRVADWVKVRIEEFINIDPGSFSFRYTHKLRGDLSVGGELWVDLDQLRTVMNVLCGGIEAFTPR